MTETTEHLPDFLREPEEAPQQDPREALLEAFGEFYDLIGDGRFDVGAFQCPLVVFSDSRARNVRVAQNVDDPTHLWMTADFKIGGHSFRAYSIDLPRSVVIEDEDDS